MATQAQRLKAVLDAAGFWPGEGVADTRPPEHWRSVIAEAAQDLEGAKLAALVWVAVTLRLLAEDTTTD